MTNETHALVSPWRSMTRPVDLKHMGKLLEELGELTAAAARCVIQGVDEREPVTGKPNRAWLEEELADVLASIRLVTTHFHLDQLRMQARTKEKIERLRAWHAMLE